MVRIIIKLKKESLQMLYIFENDLQQNRSHSYNSILYKYSVISENAQYYSSNTLTVILHRAFFITLSLILF